jgi:hypothetical protein
MEVRVMRARIPEIEAGPGGPLPGIEQGADSAATAVLADYLKGTPLAMPPPGDSLRGILRRNAIQDIGLARGMEPGEVARRAVELLQANSIFTPRPMGAEWWLRMRDGLFAQ